MTENFKNKVLNNQLLLFDGAMGTMLLQNGLKSGECPENWNITKPQVITNIHKQYLLAGANIIETNTFGANYAKLKIFNLGKKTSKINFSAVKNAKKSIEEVKIFLKDEIISNNDERKTMNEKQIFGSIGPSGKILKPYGDTTIKQMQKYFSEQVKRLIAGGVNGFIIETMLDTEEAKCIVDEIKSKTNLPIIVSFTFNKAKNNYWTLMGKTPVQCVEELSKFKIQAIGTNCGLGIDDIINIVKIYKQNTKLPILAQPNAGMPKVKNGKTVYPQNAKYFAQKIKDLIKAGATLIGGCCGTTPEYIKAIKLQIKD